MFGYVTLIFLTFLAFRSTYSLGKHRAAFTENSVPSHQVNVLQISVLLYVVSMVAFAIPVSALRYVAPIPFGFILLLPGIVIGRRLAAKLDTGHDLAAGASRVASNASWLGLAILIFIAANIGIALIVHHVGG